MNYKTVKYLAICFAVALFTLIVLIFYINGKNKTLESKIAEKQTDLSVKEIKIKYLTDKNKILDDLVGQQKKLIEGETLDEFMKMYEENREAVSVEVLVHLKKSETGLPMRFLIGGSQADDGQGEEEL